MISARAYKLLDQMQRHGRREFEIPRGSGALARALADHGLLDLAAGTGRLTAAGIEFLRLARQHGLPAANDLADTARLLRDAGITSPEVTTFVRTVRGFLNAGIEPREIVKLINRQAAVQGAAA